MYREIGPKTRSRRRVCVCVFEAKLQSFWGRGASVCFRVVCSFLGKKPPTQTIDVWEWKRKYSCPPSGLVAEGKLSAPADCPLLDRGVSASPVKVWSSVTLFLGLVVGWWFSLRSFAALGDTAEYRQTAAFCLCR